MGRSILERGDFATPTSCCRRNEAERSPTTPSALVAAPPSSRTGSFNRLARSGRSTRRGTARRPDSPRRARRRSGVLPPARHGRPTGTASTGARGFLQWQYVVPDDARGAVRRTVERRRATRQRVVPGGAQALRRGQPGAAVVPDPGLDAGARHPRVIPGLGPAARRARRGGRRGRRPRLPGQGPGCGPSCSPAMYPRLEEWRPSVDGSIPIAGSRATCARPLGLT